MAELITCDTCSKALTDPAAVRNHWIGDGKGVFGHTPRESETLDQTIARGFGEAGAAK